MDVLSASKDDDKIAWYENSKVIALADTIAPAIIWSPVDGSTDVPVASNVTITLNELVRNIDNTDLTNTNVDGLITLKSDDAYGSDIAFDATVVVGGTGSALSFDGLDDYVTVKREVQDDFSLQAWVKTTTSRNGSKFYQGLGIIYADVGGKKDDFGTSILNGKFSFGTGKSDETIQSTSSIDDGVWHHVVATREKSTGTIAVYVDGILEDSLSTENTQELSSPKNIILGANTIDSRYFKGNITQVAVWNITISSGGVKALYNSGIPLNVLTNSGDYTSASNLRGYWRFNEGTGLTTTDASGNNNNGTINGATWTTASPRRNTVITIDPANNFVSN